MPIGTAHPNATRNTSRHTPLNNSICNKICKRLGHSLFGGTVVVHCLSFTGVSCCCNQMLGNKGQVIRCRRAAAGGGRVWYVSEDIRGVTFRRGVGDLPHLDPRLRGSCQGEKKGLVQREPCMRSSKNMRAILQWQGTNQHQEGCLSKTNQS